MSQDQETTTVLYNSLKDLLLDIQNYVGDDGRRYPLKTNLLPVNQVAYEINLNTRVVNAPSVLSVQYDHNAEVIYFKCDRYYENVDLANKTCIIEYINADGEYGVYWVPYFGVDSSDSYTTLYIPWCINGLATAAPGEITYSIRFYRLDSSKKYIYNLSIRPTKGQILYGMDISEALQQSIDADITLQKTIEQYQTLNLINSATDMVAASTTYWIDL